MLDLIPLLFLIFLLLIGLLKIKSKLHSKQILLEYSYEFINTFRSFSSELQKGSFNGEKYQWLKLNSSKMQNIMGQYGIAQAYKPAGANYYFNNYQIIVNGLTEIKDIFNRMNGYGLNIEKRMLFDSMSMIDDFLLTYIGALENTTEEIKKESKNVMIWLREGVRLFVTLPISLMYWTGLIKYKTYDRLSDNLIVKFLSFLITFIGLISAIMTIVIGYESFKSIVNNILK